MPTIVTFIEVVQEGPHAEHLLSEAQDRLHGIAKVLLDDGPPVPVQFLDDRPKEDQHRATTAALTAADEGAGRPPGEWQNHLAVTGP